MKLDNPNVPANHQDIDNIPYNKRKKMPMFVNEVPIGTENRRLFKVSSSTEEGTVYDVKRLKTIAGTFVHQCECIGYQTRAKINPFFECRHIREVKSTLKTE